MNIENLSNDCGNLVENLLTFKQILERSVRLFFYFTLFNIATSIVISQILSGSISLTQVTDTLGNLALLEAMVFFFFGSAVDIFHSAKWSAAMKLLKLRNTDWTTNESRKAERGALVYVMTGVFLIVELLLLFPL
jgi:hypothetical protein